MQISFSFEPGLTHQFKSLRQVTQAAVLRTRAGVQGIAPAVDMSPSQLARKLNGNPEDPHRTLDMDDWEKVAAELVELGDLTPIFYLLEKFKLTEGERQGAAIAQLSTQLAQVAQTLAALQAAQAKPSKRTGS